MPRRICCPASQRARSAAEGYIIGGTPSAADSYGCVKGPAGCGGTAIKAELPEKYVTGAVLDALESPRVQEALREGEDQHAPRRAELLAQIRDTQERREEARRDYSDRALTGLTGSISGSAPKTPSASRGGNTTSSPDRLRSFYRAHAPHPVPLAQLVRVAGPRWKVEDGSAADKELAALDQHQVRSWTSWHRWTILALLACAFLSVLAAACPDSCQPPDDLLIPLTRNEIRRLFTGLGQQLHPQRNCTCPDGDAGIRPPPESATTVDEPSNRHGTACRSAS